jgi:hypothetical protein
MTRFRINLFQAHEGTGLCVKKQSAREGETHNGKPKTLAPARSCRYYSTASHKNWRISPEPLTCLSLLPPVNPVTAGQSPLDEPFGTVSACSALISRALEEEPLKNNIRSAHGTPVDSGRFRQVVNVRKKKCADKFCCIDC